MSDKSARSVGAESGSAYRDITLPISPEVAVFPGDPPVRIRQFARLREDGYNASAACLSLHTGTHVDAPRHLSDRAGGVDRLPLDALIGPVRLLDCRAQPSVDRKLLEACWEAGTERLLLGTGGGGALRRGEAGGGGYLTGDGAEFLAAAQIRLVGIDALSIDAPGSRELPAHRALLDCGAAVVEGLDLDGVAAGWYELICLPLRFRDGDGAPARVILVDRCV